MSAVKWIKITTDMFDNRKIKHLRRLPDGNNIILIWVMLLTMAGRCNADGKIYLTEDIPYTSKMLADELDFEENTVQLALRAMEQLGMIVSDNGFISIAGWKEYQNVEGMDRIREQTRQRVAQHRKRQKMIENDNCNVTCNVTVTQGNALEEDIERERESDKDIDEDDIESRPPSSHTYMSIIDLFNSICTSYKPVESVDRKRTTAIESLLHIYSLEKIKEAFTKAEASEFLKGTKDGWRMTFDWVIVPDNMAKVLSGNYDNWNGKKKPSNKFGQFHQREYDYGAMQQALLQKNCKNT